MGLNPLFEGDVENVISSVYIKVKDGYEIKKVTENINLRVRRVKAVQMKDMLSEIAGSLSGISKTITLLFAAVWVMVFIVWCFFLRPCGRKEKICPAPRDGNVTKKTGRDFIEELLS